MLEFRTHGKWIFAGEHTVLRGGEALVFPVQSRFLDFKFEEGGGSLELDIASQQPGLEMAFWGVLEKALQFLSIDREELKGRISLKSNIPVGAGMGASATLCASLARFFVALGKLNKSGAYEFAKSLEDLFHGESSGVDVAVALENKPLRFKRPNFMESFTPSWSPHFYLSYCGKKGVTSDCIKRVQTFIKEKPRLGEDLDQRMKDAVKKAFLGLRGSQNIELLRESIDQAGSCFREWGLVSRELDSHMLALKKAGALSVKPTGSGDGGFVLSLWETPPRSESFDFELIKA